MSTAREQWLEERRSGVGSADVAALCGLSPWGTPLSVYAQKLGLVQAAETAPMRWGLALEEVVATAYAEETGRSLECCGLACLRHPEHSWMLCTPDRFTRDDTGLVRFVVELKTARTAEGWGEPGTDEVPEGYLLQVQHQLLVGGFEAADVAVLIAGSDFRIYTLLPSPEIHERLVEITRDFWRRVETRNPPEPDWTHPRTPELVELLHVPVAGKTVTLGPEDLDEVKWYETYGQAEADYRRARAYVRARLITRLGDAEVGVLPDGRRLRRRQVHRKAYAVPAATYTDFRITHKESR